MTKAELVALVLRETKPLRFPRARRLPLYVWQCRDVPSDDDAETERILLDLDSRGIAAVSSWDSSNREQTLGRSLRVGALQKKLGLRVNVDANLCMHTFFNGDERTAHVTETGGAFFDDSFGEAKMGCPFALDFRYEAIKEQIEYFVGAYKERDIPIDFIFADWEIDGPIEWNKAWENSRRSKRCRQNIPDIEDFTAFQKTLRTIRSDMQKRVFADTGLSYFPDALVGNYGVYPHDGYRYWIDYYEDKEVPKWVPHKADQKAKYRQWSDEFSPAGYTIAMPVFYTWSWSFKWYDFADPDSRWFYNLLLTVTNACNSTPENIPIIGFVHFTTIWDPCPVDPQVKQFSAEKYKELLWHMFLRGCDGLFLWCLDEETAQEIRPLHEVYAASLEYRDFLDHGDPISFDVPSKPGPVVSGLRLEDRLLVRRTDFTETRSEVTITVVGKEVPIPRMDGVCQVIELK